jgi:hypothetical protein
VRATDGLAPERLLGSLALLLTDRVAGVARRPRVDRRAAVGRVLGDVRRDIEVAQVVDEPLYIVALAPSVSPPSARPWQFSNILPALRRNGFVPSVMRK